MYNSGDRFTVKSNGFRGRIVGRHVPGYSGTGSYEVEWDHIPGKTYLYDIKDVHDANDWEILPVVISGGPYTITLPHGFVAQDALDTGVDFSDFKGGISHADNCWHRWKEYHGFSDSFKYCELCDKKERLNE